MGLREQPEAGDETAKRRLEEVRGKQQAFKAREERRLYHKQAWFKRLQRFRAGVEARTSLLRRKFGLKQSLMRCTAGAEIWVGQGIFAHNLWQVARII